MFWYEKDKKEYSAKLVGSLTGKEREKWWEEHKNFHQAETQEKDKEEKSPVLSQPRDRMRSSVASNMILSLEGNSLPEKITQMSLVDERGKT